MYWLATAMEHRRQRVAVREAPLDVAGFDDLPPAGPRKAWEEAISAYQIHAAPLDISYGKLVDVNYAVADLGNAEHIAKAPAIPEEIRTALEKAAPVYRTVWWVRHDAANQAWLKQLRPQSRSNMAPGIVKQLTAAFQHSWPTVPLRVEVVATRNGPVPTLRTILH